MNCPSCGAKTDAQSNCCSNCGTSLIDHNNDAVRLVEEDGTDTVEEENALPRFLEVFEREVGPKELPAQKPSINKRPKLPIRRSSESRIAKPPVQKSLKDHTEKLPKQEASPSSGPSISCCGCVWLILIVVAGFIGWATWFVHPTHPAEYFGTWIEHYTEPNYERWRTIVLRKDGTGFEKEKTISYNPKIRRKMAEDTQKNISWALTGSQLTIDNYGKACEMKDDHRTMVYDGGTFVRE